MKQKMLRLLACLLAILMIGESAGSFVLTAAAEGTAAALQGVQAQLSAWGEAIRAAERGLVEDTEPEQAPAVLRAASPEDPSGGNRDGGDGHSGTSTYNEADGNKIESVHLVWNTPDTRDNGSADDLWLSTMSRDPLTMKFTLQVNLSGQADAGDYAPGSIRIRIPRQIWHKRDVNGDPGDTLEDGYGKMDLPITIKPTASVDWYYEVDGDDYVIINNKRIGATSNHTFECAVYDIKPLDIVDESISDALMVHVDALTSEGNTIWMESNTLRAQIDTSVRINSAYKTAKFYEFIDDDDGVPQNVLNQLPSGTSPEDYVYVKWTTYARMYGNQYYDLQMNDDETWCYDHLLNQETNTDYEVEECQGIFIAQTSGPAGEIYNDGKSYKNEQVVVNNYYEDSPTIILWAAYPNASFQNGHTYYFRNKDHWDLLEHDPAVEYWEGTDPQAPSDKDASGSVNFTKMTWDYPPGRFLAFKYIESNKGHTHPNYNSDPSYGSHSHQYTYEMVLNHLRDGEDAVMDYEVFTVGYGYIFTAGPLGGEVGWIDINGQDHSASINPQYDPNWDSEEWIQDPDHFCNWYYVMDTSDRWDFFNYVNREGGDPQLTGDDYQFEGVYIQAPEMFSYARQKNPRYRFKSDTPFGFAPDSTLQKPVVELWVEYNNSARIDRESNTGSMEGWVKLGEYQVDSGMLWVPFDNTTEQGIVTGYRTVVTTNEAACKLTVYPRITLKATDRVRSIVNQLFAESDTPSTTFRNDDNLYVELFKTAEDQSIYDPVTNPDGKVHPNQEMFLPEDVNYRADIWDDSAIAKFTGAGYGISLNKSVKFNPVSVDNGGDNDVTNKRAILHYSATCTQKSNLSTLARYMEAVELNAVQQDFNCVWYDLLPEKVQPLVDTVRMTRSGDTVLRTSTIENYKGTGRTLLIVECDLTPDPHKINYTGPIGDEITIAFEAYITWLDMNSMPENYQLMNYIAYESGIEGQVGTLKGLQGEHDTIQPTPRLNNGTPTNVPDKIAAALTDLDPNTDDGRFVYARAPVSPMVNMDAHTEYVKYVKSDLDGIWTQGLDGQQQVNVYEGHKYTYSLRVSSAKDTNTWDMVFYDSLENYLIPRPDPDDPMHDATKEADYNDTREKANWDGDWKEGTGGAPGGQWRGRLYQVDLSEFYEMDCKPVLYYSTIPWMQFSDSYGEQVNESVIFEDAAGHYMLEDTATWTQVDMSTLTDGKWDVPDGLEVTAIAIDATRTTDGEKFVLKSKESVAAYLHMIAPDDHGDESQWHAKGAYAHKTDAASTNEDIDWEAATDPVNNMHAFNNTRLISRQANDDSGSMSAFLTMIRNDYTRVGIMPEIKRVEKVWDDDDNHDNIRPDSITVEMLRKTQGVAGDYELVVDETTGEPVTMTLTPTTVVEMDGDSNTVETEVWEGIFYQVPVVDEQGRRYLYQFRDTVEGYTCTSKEDSTGKIILTNKHKNETIPIQGEKQWMMPDGTELSEEAESLLPSSIKVRLYRTGSSGEKELVATKTVTPDDNGHWTYDFGEQEKFERGGTEYVYTLEEDPVDKFVSSLEDPADLPEDYEIPFLSSADYDPDTLEIFYNFYMPFGDLSVQKNILQATDVSKEQAFTFTVKLLKPGTEEEEQQEGSYDYAIYNVSTNADTGEGTLITPAVSTGTIESGGTVQLKGGQRLVIKKLPAGTLYTFTEAEADGWNTPENPSDPSGPETTNASGSVRTGKTTASTFTNTYKAEGYAQVQAHKMLTGREYKASQFKFELVDLNPDSETYNEAIRTIGAQAPTETVQDEETGVITSQGEIKFGALVYTQADAGKIFKYQVREVNAEKPGYEYSTAVFEVQVTVTDNGDGTMTCTVSPEDPAGRNFDNTYTAEGSLTLRGWKVLQKRDPEDQEFEFELWESNENGAQLGSAPLQTVKNDADGNVVFAPLTFDQDQVSVDPENNPRVYYYLMVEKDTGDETIIYSGYRHLFIVTPQDNGNGTISFDQSEKGFDEDGNEQENGVPVFINDVKNGSLKVSKTIVNGNPATKFTFRIKLVGLGTGTFSLERTDGGTTGQEDDGSGDDNEEEGSSGILPIYHADESLITGRNAYAALNVETGEFIFFRSDPNSPMDPWGNAFSNTGFTNNKQVSTDGKFVWYNNVESGRAWSNDSTYRSKIIHVSMRDPVRPTTFYYYFDSCSNIETMDLSLMDIPQGQTVALWNFCTGLSKLKEANFGNMNLMNVTDTDKLFRYCSSLETVNIGNFQQTGHWDNTSYFRYAFENTKVTRITINDLTKFNGNYNVNTWHHYPTAFGEYDDEWVNVDTDEKLNSYDLFTQGGHGGTWELDPKYYNIHFDGNGGTGSMSDRHINVHRDFTTGYNFYKFGYDFVGFRDNYGTLFEVGSDGKIKIPSNTYSSYIEAGEELDVTLTAEWTPMDSSAEMTGDTITVTMYGGESITINDIPAYTAYEVWEQVPAGWILISKSNDSGVIQPLETSVAEFTDEYAPDKASVSMTASKLMDGELAGDYKIGLYNADSNWDPIGDPIDTKMTTDGGIASFDIIQYGPEEVGDHRYVIMEIVDNPDPTIEYDTHKERVTVNVSDDGKGNMKAVAGYHDNNGVFKNNTKPGSLKLSKQIENATIAVQDQNFLFKISFTDGAGNPAVMKLNGSKITSLKGVIKTIGSTSAGTTGTYNLGSASTIYVYLKGNQQIEFEKVPADVQYQVEEVAQTGWTVTQQSGTTGTIESNETCVVSFTNAYSAKGKLTFAVEKRLEGETPEARAYQFEAYAYAYQGMDSGEIEETGDWDLAAKAPASGAQPIETVNNGSVDNRETLPRFTNDDGEARMPNPDYGASLAQFSPIDVTKEGYYYYAIREVPGDDSTMNYDPDVVYACVYMRDVRGEGILEPIYTVYFKLPDNSLDNIQMLGMYGYLDYWTDAANPLAVTWEQAENYISYDDGYMMTALIDYTYPVYTPFEEEQAEDAFRGFLNTRKDGALQITKDVTGATEAGSGKEFTISVKLTDKNGNLLTDQTYPTTLDGEEGPDMTTDENGVGTVKIKDGQTVVILNLPHGAEYELTEENLPGGFTLDSVEGDTGTIVGDETSEAAFHNSYDAKGKLVLTAKKVMDPSEILTLDANRFTFELKDDRGTVLRTASNNADGEVKFGAINYTMSDLGKTFVYTVSEALGDNLTPQDEESPYATDQAIYDVTVTISDNGDGTLSAEPVFTLNQEDTDLALFSNTMRTKVYVTKTWKGDAKRIDLRPSYIVVNLYADGELQMSRSINAERYSTDDPNVWKYTIDNLPMYKDGQEIEYTLTEDALDDYVQVVTKDGNEFSVENTYLEASVTFSGTKTLVDRPLREGEFSFVIEPENEDQPMPAEDTVSNAADGGFSFGDIHYRLGDLAVDGDGNRVSPTEYVYHVREVLPEEFDEDHIKDDIEYDLTTYDVTVTLTFDEEAQTFTAEASIDSKALDFTNTYRPYRGELDLSASKLLNDKDPGAWEFQFTLTPQEDAPARALDWSVPEWSDLTEEQLTVVNDGGTVTFPTLNFIEEDAGKTFVYTVQEVVGDETLCVFDDTLYTVTVTVAKDENRRLAVDAVITGGDESDEGMVFRNDSLAELTLIKIVESEHEITRDFRFTITLTDPEGNPVEGTFTYSVYAYEEPEEPAEEPEEPVEPEQPEEEQPADEGGTKEADGEEPVTEEPGEEPVTEEPAEELELLREGTVCSGGVIALKDHEMAVIHDLPMGTTAVVQEEELKGYEKAVTVVPTDDNTVIDTEQALVQLIVPAADTTITMINTEVVTSFRVSKVWVGAEGGSISLTIGTVADNKFVPLDPQPAIEQNGNEYAVNGLPKYYDNNEEIVYAAKEAPMPGYGLRVYTNLTGESRFALNDGVIVNTETTEVRVRKEWAGLAKDAVPPEITLTLYKDGVPTAKKARKGSDGWYYFHNLEAHHEYYVVEEYLAHFTPVYKNDTAHEKYTDRVYPGGTIVNVYVPTTGDGEPLGLWIGLSAAAALGLVFLAMRKKCGGKK